MSAPAQDLTRPGDQALAARIAARDPEAVRTLVTANNQRLFRTAWSILGNRAEAEDVVQSAYLHAFAAIGSFEGRASLGTWLMRIAINEARQRLRAARRRAARLDADSVIDLGDYREKLMRGSLQGTAPDADLARAQIRTLLENAIADLPRDLRTVFVLREVEGLAVDDVAGALGIPDTTVRTRHLRARRRLQNALEPDLRTALRGSFPFAGPDCAAMTDRIIRAWSGQAR